jgi:hypothetical protein
MEGLEEERPAESKSDKSAGSHGVDKRERGEKEKIKKEKRDKKKKDKKKKKGQKGEREKSGSKESPLGEKGGSGCGHEDGLGDPGPTSPSRSGPRFTFSPGQKGGERQRLHDGGRRKEKMRSGDERRRRAPRKGKRATGISLKGAPGLSIRRV